MWGKVFASAVWAALSLPTITSPASVQPTGPNGELETIQRQASELSRVGRFADAVPLSLRARELAERQFGPRAPELAHALCDLAYLYLKLRHYDDAETAYQRALAIYDDAAGHYEGRTWNLLERLLEVYANQARVDESIVLRARVRTIEQAVSAPFNSEIPQLELITTDLKRIRTQDCGVISFKVDDPRALLFNFERIEDVQRRIGLQIGVLLRRIIGPISSSQILSEPDRIAVELSQALDSDGKEFGYSVRLVPAQLATCLR
jgi:tetratricopeptide (TPR) repeat protein